MTLRLSPYTFLCTCRKGFYFRIRGKGLSVGLDQPRLFSERFGFKKVFRMGRLSVEVIR